MFKLVNVMEGLVMETIDEVLKANINMCGCERCKLDLAALALNQLPASYVVTTEGEVLLRTNTLRQQFKVDIIRAVTEASKIVSERPHHPKRNH